MATNKWILVLFGTVVVSAWVFDSAILAGAETLNFKGYTYVVKAEKVPVGDVDGHDVTFMTRRAFLVFENGEVATQRSVITSDSIKASGSFLQYSTITFSDGSTIILKVQGTAAGTASGATVSSKMTREIIKGTGRFEGIKGTGAATVKYFPIEEGEAGPKGIGEGSITYTLPTK